MGMALAIATRGVICSGGGGGVEVVVSDHPVLHPTVEVRPAIMSATLQGEAPGPAGEPVIMTAADMKPVIRQGESELPSGSATEPDVMSATDLKPVIRSAEEE